MNSQNQTQENEDFKKPVVPDGVKMIAILNYTGFGFMVLLGLILLVLGVYVIFISGLEIIEGVDGAGYYLLFMLMGFAILSLLIFFVCFTILLFFIGRGLWQLKRWARKACVILGCIGMTYGIKIFVESLLVSDGRINGFSLLIISFNALIAGYLMFNKKVKQAFTEKL